MIVSYITICTTEESCAPEERSTSILKSEEDRALGVVSHIHKVVNETIGTETYRAVVIQAAAVAADIIEEFSKHNLVIADRVREFRQVIYSSSNVIQPSADRSVPCKSQIVNR